MIKIKMTIDECLAFADGWSRNCTFHENSQGWRVVCMLLAGEVRSQRAALREIVEIYAGMEGFKIETAPEAYQRRIIEQMYEVAAERLKQNQRGDKDEH